MAQNGTSTVRIQQDDLILSRIWPAAVPEVPRRGGQPLRPEYVLRRFHRLSDQAGLPRTRVHDPRHFAATTMLSANVPLSMASKTLRHSTVSMTTEIYTHLLGPAAREAVDAIAKVLAAADAA